MARKHYEIDMCRGPMVKNMVRFAIPLVLTGIVQMLFTAADLAVVGRCVNDTALAAVGSTGSITGLVTVLFFGMSAGVNLVVARLYGAGDARGIHRATHTSILFALIGGIVLATIGFALSASLVRWVNTPAEVYDQALLYIRITFLGMPASLTYHFGSAILRAYGDTKRPFYFITFAGALNVVLNLLFVLVFGMDVDGVALGTVLSNAAAAALVLICLMRSEGICRLSLRDLRLYGDMVREIVRIGLPAGLQSAMFDIAGVAIQSSINSLGKEAMIARTTVGSIENLVYPAMAALAQATLCYVSQNHGAKQYRRIRRVRFVSIALSMATGIVLGGIVLLFGDLLLRIYTEDPTALVSCKEVLLVSMLTLFICGIMDPLAGMVRGLGYSVTPMAAALVGICGTRILWVYTVFAAYPTLTVLYLSYPVSWVITSLAHFLTLTLALRKLPKEDAPLAEVRAD